MVVGKCSRTTQEKKIREQNCVLFKMKKTRSSAVDKHGVENNDNEIESKY